jgi:hypothetical protein
VHSKRKTTTIISNDSKVGVPFSYCYVPEPHPSSVHRPGMEFRTSIRWFSHGSSVRKARHVPFVSISGKVSIHTLYIWKCLPQQLFTSMISTTYKRLLKIITKRFHRVKYDHRNACIKAAILYYLNLNDSFIDRFLGMFRKGTPMRSVMNYLQYCVSGLDENKRFVYSHAFYQAKWLKFQSLGTRDKSRIYELGGWHLKNLFANTPTDSDEVQGISFLERACSFWRYEPLISDRAEVHTHHPFRVGSELYFSSSDLSERFEDESEAWSSD